MKERVAIATVQGKAYFLIVNKLREQNISFISLVPGEPVPAKVRLVITTEQEKSLVKHEKILVVQGEDELDNLINEVQKILLGKEAFERIVIGIDPGEATGLAVMADGKVIEEGNCYSTQEVINNITKAIRNVNFSQTAVSVKIGNGVPVYKELLEALDGALPPQVALEVVSEAGTNKPLKENRHSRGIRHISSAIHIAGRTERIVPRRKQVAANSRIQ
jgi:transcriptional accessory protein Tex/SPT6